MVAYYEQSVAQLAAREVITPVGAAYFHRLADSLGLWSPFGKTDRREGPRIYLRDVDAIAPFLLGELGELYEAESHRRSLYANREDSVAVGTVSGLIEYARAQFDDDLSTLRWLRDTLTVSGIAPGYTRELGAMLAGAAGADTLPTHCAKGYSWGALSPRRTPAGVVPEHRTTKGTHSRKLLADVFATGLLDTLSYERTIATIDSCRFSLESSLLYFAMTELRKRNQYPEALAEQHVALNDLVEVELLTRETVDSLLGSYRPRELKPSRHIARLLIGAYAFDPSAYRADSPAEAFPQLIRDVAEALFPELPLGSVAFDLADTTRYAERPGRLTLSLGGETAVGRFWFDRKPEPGEPLTVAGSLFEALNAALAELGDPRRVVYWHERDVRDEPYHVVAALTEEEFAATGSLIGGSNQPSFDTRFTRGNVAALLRAFDSLGVFSALAPEARARGERCALERHVSGYGDVLECFPEVFMRMWWEGIGSDSAYALLLGQLAQISRGGFRPTDVSDDFVFGEDRPVTLAFTLDGERFSTQFDYRDDWYDPSALEAVAAALDETEAAGGFYFVPDGFEASYLVWLDDAQARWLQEGYPRLVAAGSQVAKKR